MTEIELANKLKIDISTMRSWESGGGAIPTNILKKLSNIPEVSSDMILFGEDRNPLIIEHLTDEQQKAIRTLYKLMKEGE